MLRCMRTTLTLEDDVAALLKRAIARSKKSLKDQINEALRIGLTSETRGAASRRRRLTHTYDGGRPLVNLDSVAEALAIAEGEAFR